MSIEFVKANRLYFYVTGVVDTTYILDFETLMEEHLYCNKLAEYLKKHSAELKWISEGASTVVAGSVTNYAPPKVSSFLSVDPSGLIDELHFEVSSKDCDSIRCEIEEARIHFYLFSSAVLEFKVRVPEEHWRDIEALSCIRYFLQRSSDPSKEFKRSLETIFGPSVARAKHELDKALKVTEPPLLESTVLDFTKIEDSVETQLLWSHATLIAIMPEDFDPCSKHYQDILLDVNPTGIHNFAIRQNLFAFVESGNSLICIPDVPDSRGRSPEQVAQEDWAYWVAVSQYTWKTVWDLDRGLYAILNLVTSHLARKRTESYGDVYAVNALINKLTLLLDTHKPRNMTSTYYSIDFLEKINKSWRTDEMTEAACGKMESLKDLIGQLDEIQATRREKRIEMFLSLLGVFTLGSMVLDFIGALAAGATLNDPTILFLAIGIPSVFVLIAYMLLR
ncbi:MAG: hypothetical protein P1Q69_11780 [Candidatus Thorarchaeota archaeon]|nr:hypothetical protein [Candidatus Thorarchaeota archaeon]